MQTKNSSKAILYITTLFFWFSQSSYTSYISPTLKTMGATATFIGFVVGAYGFTQLLLRIPMGIIADLYNLQKKIINFGVFLAVCSTLGLYLTYSPMGFLFFRSLAGCASATWLCFSIVYGSYYEPSESASAMSVLSSANYAGRLIGLIIMGFVTESLGVRPAFLIAFAGAIISFAFSLFVKNCEPTLNPLRVHQLASCFNNKYLIKISILAVLAQFIVYATTYSFSTVVARNLSATNLELAVLNIISFICLTASSLLAGKILIVKFGTRKLLLLGSLFLLAYCVSMAFVNDIRLLYPLQILTGLGEGLLLPILTGLCTKEIESDKKTSAMGFFSATYGLGITIGPIIMGILVDNLNYTISFLFMGVVAAISGIIVWTSLEN